MLKLSCRSRLLALLLGWVVTAAWGDDTQIDEIVVTAVREPIAALRLPFSVYVIDQQQIHQRQFRTLPQALRDVPGIMVQETAFGQGSPHLRGFTGFRTLMLIDGVRLNNAVFRDGPNQYWATVDLFGIDRLEVVQGPASTLYGSDAIGGTVNALTIDPFDADSRVLARVASAEQSASGRVQAAWQPGAQTALVAAVTGRTSDDLDGGHHVGKQGGVGFDEHGMDLKVSHRLGAGWTLDGLLQQVRQNNVPRTHSTREAVSWHGTTVGSDLRRELDQERNFGYLRLSSPGLPGVVQSVSLTAAGSRVKELTDRIRSSGTREKHDFEVDTLGLLAALQSETPFGLLTYGVDYYLDSVDSSSTTNPVQGPVGDDARYQNLDVYLQNRFSWLERGELLLGVRHTEVDTRVRRVLDPLSSESFRIEEDWSATVASGGISWALSPDRMSVFANIAQGYRAPNLSDLTRFDSARTNEIEVPVPGLEEERFLSLETGLKINTERVDLQFAYFHTDIDDLITRVPTGEVLDGEFVVSKANVGDGVVKGMELSWQVALDAGTSLFGHATWMDGCLETYPTSNPVPASEPIDRLMPPSGAIGLRWSPDPGRLWLEGQLVAAEGQRDLSTRDAQDTSRIPPGGTPGYAVVHLRGGFRFSSQLAITLGIENLTDRDYRIHGSGTNMPGRNLIMTLAMEL